MGISSDVSLRRLGEICGSEGLALLFANAVWYVGVALRCVSSVRYPVHPRVWYGCACVVMRWHFDIAVSSTPFYRVHRIYPSHAPRE